jgi:hypothetical protein
MRWLKDSPDLSHNSYTPAIPTSDRKNNILSKKETAFGKGNHYDPTASIAYNTRANSSKKSQTDIPRSHNYTPRTSQTAKTWTASTIESDVGRRHSYVPPVSPQKSARNLGKGETKEADAVAGSNKYVPPTGSGKLKNSWTHDGQGSEPREVVKKSNPAPPLPALQKPEEVAKIQEPVEEEMSEEDKEKQRVAALKIQSFVRGAMCRARVSDMLLALIEGLLAEKDQKKPQHQVPENEEKKDDKEEETKFELEAQQEHKEEEEVIEEEVVEGTGAMETAEDEGFADPENEDQGVFEALSVEPDVEQVPETADKSAAAGDGGDIVDSHKTKDMKEKKVVSFVDAENQIKEIERAWEYGRLPKWWMDHVLHKTLPDDEADEAYAVTGQSDLNSDETTSNDEMLKPDAEIPGSDPEEVSRDAVAEPHPISESDTGPEPGSETTPETKREIIPEPAPENAATPVQVVPNKMPSSNKMPSWKARTVDEPAPVQVVPNKMPSWKARTANAPAPIQVVPDKPPSWKVRTANGSAPVHVVPNKMPEWKARTADAPAPAHILPSKTPDWKAKDKSTSAPSWKTSTGPAPTPAKVASNSTPNWKTAAAVPTKPLPSSTPTWKAKTAPQPPMSAQSSADGAGVSLADRMKAFQKGAPPGASSAPKRNFKTSTFR